MVAKKEDIDKNVRDAEALKTAADENKPAKKASKTTIKKTAKTTNQTDKINKVKTEKVKIEANGDPKNINEVNEKKESDTKNKIKAKAKKESKTAKVTSDSKKDEEKTKTKEKTKTDSTDTVKKVSTESIDVKSKKSSKDDDLKKTDEKKEIEKSTDVKVEISDTDTQEAKGEKKPEAFDWNSLGKNKEIYSEKERSSLEDIYNKTLNAIVEHEVVNGTIVSKSSREVVVNIGFKSDGVIAVNELRYNPDIKVGDKIEVYVESQEDTTGQLILSHKKARILKSWDRINEAHDKDEIINGFVKSRTKGGLIVDVFGIEAFLPGSQIDVKPIRDYDIYVNKTMEFKVVKINHEYKNVVVSHKALIEDELEHQKTEIIAKLEKGQVLEGSVKNITSYGVFIDLGGVDGLIHITDLSWGRINHPEEIVELDQKIKVVILDFDDNKKRIALGLKQLTPHPWDALDGKLSVGDKVKGKVVVIADYGAFVEIAPGVEGLIHVSEMSWSQHLRTAQDFLKVGDEVEAQILTLERDDRRMSLGMKQMIPDPWSNIQDRYPKDSKHKATVRNFTNFGIFVELEEGVDGLIHISDLSWSKKIKHPAEFTKIGESIDVIVLEVDEENRRLSLGHKQLEENPWEVFETVFTLNSIHKATIASISEKGAIVTLPYGVEGFVPSRHLIKEDNNPVQPDESLEFKVIEFSKENKKIILSHTKVYQEDQQTSKTQEPKKKKSETKKKVLKMKENIEKTTLGDLDALANLKTEMEETEKKAKEKNE